MTALLAHRPFLLIVGFSGDFSDVIRPTVWKVKGQVRLVHQRRRQERVS